MKAFLFLGLIVAFCVGCASSQPSESAGKRLTVGTVQKEIRMGMSAAEVAEALGSPNIVTTDEERREVWIYDKMATEASYSSKDGYVFALILGGSSSAKSSSVSQRTLTVIIKFDENKKVRDFAYHASSF